MTAPTYPPVLRQPIAADAGDSFITNPMPESPTGTNAASIEAGFPPITMTEELAGGEPPLGPDMNGFLFLLSSHLVYLQSGLPYLFDADVATALGGYPIGAVIGMADGTGSWINNIANNMGNPDTASPGSTAGWAVLTSYGPALVPGLTGGAPQILTPAQTKKPVVIFSGTLTANQTVALSQIPYEWTLVNNCTGPFVLTVTAGSGASVTVPQGGFGSPLGVYSIGDGNLYPSVAPLSIPISQGPDPSTIAERTNAGYLLATYFNSTIGYDNLSLSGIYTETAGDGFIRKNTVANFQAQLALANFAGQVTNGQVPYSVVQQWAATFFANAALTGVPTAPTAAVGTATSQIATTAFVNPGSGTNSNGSFRRNSDGSIDQWGSFAFTANGGTVARTFPVAFPNAVESVVIGAVVATAGVGGAGSYIAHQPAAPTLGGFQYSSIASSNPAITVHWEAKGR